MEELTRLVRPSSSSVTVDTTLKECSADGFNYPSFRLLNKQTRVTLAKNFLNGTPGFSYRLFAAANSKGWFAAVSNDGAFSLIFSPLSDLRSAIKNASGTDSVLAPQRTLPLPNAEPCILAFTLDESRLIVGFKQGTVVVYETDKLFSPGSGEISPLHVLQSSSSPPLEILVNPSNESGLIAILRADGTVQILNSQLEFQGGWMAENFDSTPIAVDWSPKGKQIAIGLRHGDICTFTLENKASPQKHFPPTCQGQLTSLTWLSPGHTFRVAYVDPSSSSPTHQFVYFDSRSSKLCYTNLNCPFPVSDRPQSIAQIMTLPRWDEVPGTPDEHRSLLVVGDVNSVDLEVLGVIGTRWFQQSQENPLSIPLDKNLEDTFLLGLSVDLTDPESQRPIMYAYLNDGTVQAWYLEHPTPYPRMMTPGATATSTSPFASTQQSTSTQSSGSSFGQPASGQPSPFGAQSTQAFGQSSFGSAASNGFGQAQQTTTFGQSSFGQPTVFGSNSSGSTFGSSSSSTNAFNAFSGSGPTAFGQGGFGGSSSSFGTSTPASVTATPPEMTREASMEDSTFFGSLSLGGGPSEPRSNKTSMFGTPPPLPLPPDHPSNKPPTPGGGGFGAFGGSGTSGFGNGSTSGNSFIKPASGFGVGAFNSSSPFANPATTQNQPPAFSAGSTSDSPKPDSHPAFGSSGFSSPSATTSGGFGAFGNKSTTFGSAANTGGFASFSTGPSSFGSALQNNTSTTSAFGGSQTDNGPKPFGGSTATGGFAAFGGSGPSSFGASSSDKTTSASGQTGFGGGSVFGQPSSGSTFGSGAASGNSAFTLREPPVTPSKDVTAAPQNSTSSGIPPSPPSPSSPSSPSSPLPSPTPFKNSSSAGVFSNLKASPIGPGMGAFGASISSDSPFLKAAQNQNPPPVSAFNLSTTPTPSSGTTTTTPTFGARSALGGPQKSTFAAPTPPTSSTPTTSGGAFEAYSGSTFGFGSAAGPRKSFAELSTGSGESTSAPKSAFPSVSGSSEKRTPVFTPPIKEEEKAKEEEKPQENSSQSANVAPTASVESISSQTSSYVEVSKEDTEGKEEEEESDPPASDKDGDGDGEGESETEEEDSDFLSEHVTTEEEDNDEIDDREDEPTEPTKVPLPPSRSPSSTPQPEESSNEDSSSPSDGSSSGRLSTIREESTTPPGSPTREPLPTQSPAPTPTSAANLGLGRPSTRPSRSSPLASTPPSIPEEEEKKAIEKQSLKPRPASPRGVFGVLPEKPKADVRRSKTPPAPKSAPPSTAVKTETATVDGLFKQSKSMFDAPLKAFKETLDDLNPQLQKLADEGKLMAPGAAPSSLSPAKAPPSPSPISPFGQAASPTDAKQPFFGKSAASTPTSTPHKPTLPWGQFSGAQSSPPTFSPSPSTPPLTAFGLKTPPAGGAAPAFPTSGLFGLPQPQPSVSATSAPMLPPPVVEATEVPLEEGMQKECALLLVTMNKDLEGLRIVAQNTATKRQELTRKIATGVKRKEDLGDATKWGLRDSEQFGAIMKSFQNDLVEVGTIVSGHKEAIQDLRSGMLKTTTRKEEIARFHKAKKDNEFAKMLRSRTLGPEHLETQTQLRRKIRAMHTRIHQLEDHIKASKKKLSQAKSGKPSLHAPSIDTINRTYRNIDIAISQQQSDVARLTARISKLNLSSSSSRPSRQDRDPRLPDPVPQGSTRAITPNVAVTTAAALNSERSAQRLKKALLAARKEPLLNSKASSSAGLNFWAGAPVAFNTPVRVPAQAQGLTFNTPIPMNGPLFKSSTNMNLTDFPEDNFNPTGFSTPTRRGAGGAKKHSGPVPLKKSGAGTPSPEPNKGSSAPGSPSFDWGPLPTFNQPARPVDKGFQPISLGKKPTLFS